MSAIPANLRRKSGGNVSGWNNRLASVAQVDRFGAVEVLDHAAPGCFGVLGANRLQDAGVRTDRIRIIMDRPAHRETVGHDAVQGNEHPEANPVARHFPDDPVETLVAGGDVGEGSGFEVTLHVADGFFELLELILCMAFGGAGGEFRLEDAARFIELAEGDAVDEKQEVERSAESGGGILREVSAIAHALPDDPHHFEGFEGLTDRGAIDAEALRQIAFGRELGAVMQVAVEDHLFETSHERRGQVPIRCRGHQGYCLRASLAKRGRGRCRQRGRGPGRTSRPFADVPVPQRYFGAFELTLTGGGLDTLLIDLNRVALRAQRRNFAFAAGEGLLKTLNLIVIFALGISVFPAFGGNVTYVCDSSIGTDLCTTLNNTVGAQYGLVFSNVSASIYIQYGATGGTIGENTQFYNTVLYSQYYAALQTHLSGVADNTAFSTLSATSNPYGGGLGVAVTSALDSALGLLGAHGINPNLSVCAIGSQNCYNDVITLSDSASFSYDAGSYSPGQYDFFTTVEHETNEALGTSSCLANGLVSLSAGCSNGVWGVSSADLFRYIAPGQLGFTVTGGTGGTNGLPVTLGQGNYDSPDLGPNTTGAYFSIDGGNTALADFYDAPNGPDYGDLATTCKHVQDAYGCSQASGINILNDGGAELAMLDAVGYALTPQGQALSAAYVDTPEVSSIAMLVLGLCGIGFVWRRRMRPAAIPVTRD